jgi:hypothetical protein
MAVVIWLVVHMFGRVRLFLLVSHPTTRPGAACQPDAKCKVRPTGRARRGAGGGRGSRRVVGGTGSGGARADHGFRSAIWGRDEDAAGD